MPTIAPDLSTLADTVAVPDPPQPDFAGIPQSTAPPAGMLDAFGKSPWDIDREKHAQSLTEWRTTATREIDSALADPVKFFRDTPAAGGRTKQESETLAINDLFIARHAGAPDIPTGGLKRHLLRQRVAAEAFDGRGADSEEAFHAEILADSTRRKQGAAMLSQIATAAANAAVLGQVSPEQNSTAWPTLRDTLRTQPGYDPKREADLAEAFHDFRKTARDRMAPFVPQLAEVWHAMNQGGAGTTSEILKAGLSSSTVLGAVADMAAEAGKQDAGATAFRIYGGLPEDQRGDFMSALGLLARTFPKNTQAGFFANLAKQGGRDIDALGRGAVEAFMANSISSLGAMPLQVSSPGAGNLQQMNQRQADQTRADYMARRNFAADTRRIEQADFDPMKSAWRKSGAPGTVEGGLYGIPGALASTAEAAVPFVGLPLMYLSMQGQAFDDLRNNAMQAGADEATASRFADQWAPIAAVPQAALEKLEAGAWTGKIPGVQKAMDWAGDMIRNRALRLATRSTIAGIGETVIEDTQDAITYAVQDIANALGQNVPDVKWTGPGGALDGLWAQTPATFISMLPLSIIGAAGGLSHEARAKAFAEAGSLRRLALGITPEHDVAIDTAAKQGLASLSRAVNEALSERDPNSDSAKEAVAKLEAEHAAGLGITEAGQSSGILPAFRVNPDKSITVIDSGTGEEIGTADTHTDAVRIATADLAIKEENHAAVVAHLGGMLAAMQSRAKDGAAGHEVSFVYEPFRQTTAAEQIGTDPASTARVWKQLGLTEAMDPARRDQVLANSFVHGFSETEFRDGILATTNRILGTGTITTVFHEDTHGLRRVAMQRGTFTRDEQIAALRAIDAAMSKAGGTLAAKRFLSATMDADVTEEHLDEAFAELMESEVIRTGVIGTKGTAAAPGIISRYFEAAYEASPFARVALSKLRGMARYLRAMYGEVFGRAVAIRRAIDKGHLNEGEHQAMLAKLMGTDEAAQANAQALETAREIIDGVERVTYADGTAIDVPFSIGPRGEDAGGKSFALAGTRSELPAFMRDSLETARAMAAEGKDAETIRALTGWFPGKYDGKLRWEIPDQDARYLPATKDWDRSADAWSSTLGEVIDHPALFAAYPEAREIKVTRMETSTGNGRFEPKDNRIYINALSSHLANFSTLLHEVQHWIQDKEGFAAGSSPMGSGARINERLQQLIDHSSRERAAAYEEFARIDTDIALDREWDADAYQRAEERLAALPQGQEMIALHSILSGDSANSINHTTSQFYHRSAGEIEARDVQARQGYTAEQRAATAPYSSENIAPGDAVVMFAGSTEGASDGTEGPAFSISHASQLDALVSKTLSLSKDPAFRAAWMARTTTNLDRLRRDRDRIKTAFGKNYTERALTDERTRKSIAKESAMRQALRRQELEDEAWGLHHAVLSQPELALLKHQPIHEALADPNNPLRGRIMSRGAATKAGKYDASQHGDFDGADGVNPTVFGGQLMPDQAAQELYEAHLIKEPTADAMWDALRREQAGVANMREYLAAARADVAQARVTARTEAKAWEAAEIKRQGLDHSLHAKIIRAFGMLDGITYALPPELRGKLGIHTATLAKLKSDEARLEYLDKTLDRASAEVEKWMVREYGKMWGALLDREQVKKNEPGKKPTGKAGADVHALFAVLRQAEHWTAAEAEDHAEKLEGRIAKGTLSPEDEAHAILEAQLVRLVGGWHPVRKRITDPKTGKETVEVIEPGADASRRAAAVENATRVFEAGYYRFRLEKLQQAEDRAIRRDQLKQDTGTGGTAPERDRKMLADNNLKGGWAKDILSLGSFEQILHRVFGEKSTEANRLADWERNASNQTTDAVFAKTDALDDLFQRLAGSSYAGEVLRWKLAQPSLSIEGRQLSQLQAITATLMWRQEAGRRHMEGHKDGSGQPVGEWHYGQAFVDACESALSPEALEVREHIADAYAGEWPTLNPIFRRLNGIDLPRNANYSPITVDPIITKDTAMDMSGAMISAGSTTPGSLRTRGADAIAEPDFRDALQTYIAHIKQIEHWKATAEFSAEAQALLSHRSTRNAAEAKGSKEAVKVLRLWLENIAQGGVRDSAAQLGLNQRFTRMSNRAAATALVGRATVIAVQSVQLGAALAEMPTGAYLKRLGLLTTGQLGWGDAMRSPYIQRRLKQLPPVVRQAVEGLQSAEPNRVKFAVAKLGNLIGGADARFTAGTYAMVLDYQRTQAAKLNLTGQAAEDYAHAAAERSTDRVAQPTRAGARSLYENTATNPMVRVSWAFASEARQKLALPLFTIANPDADAGRKARAIAVTWIVGGAIVAMIRAAARDARDPEDDEWFDEKNWGAKRLVLSTLTGPFQGMPLLGDIVEAGIYKAAGEYLPEGNLFSSTGQAAQAVTNIPDWLTGERDLSRAIKDAEAMLSGMGIFNDTISAAASLSHLARDIYGVTTNATD